MKQAELTIWDAQRHQVLTLDGHGWQVGVMSDADREEHWPMVWGGETGSRVDGRLGRYFHADILAALRWQAERVVFFWSGRQSYFIHPQIQRLKKLFPDTEFVSAHAALDHDRELMAELKWHAVTRRTCFIVPAKARAFAQIAGRIGFTIATSGAPAASR